METSRDSEDTRLHMIEFRDAALLALVWLTDGAWCDAEEIHDVGNDTNDNARGKQIERGRFCEMQLTERVVWRWLFAAPRWFAACSRTSHSS